MNLLLAVILLDVYFWCRFGSSNGAKNSKGKASSSVSVPQSSTFRDVLLHGVPAVPKP